MKSGPLNMSKTELVPIGWNLTKTMCVFGLNFIIKRIVFRHKIFKNAIFGAEDSFKQASKQKRMVGCFLEI